MTCISHKRALSTKQHMEHIPVMLKDPHVPEGKTGITLEAKCLCCMVSLERLADYQGCLSWNNFDIVLAV